MKNPLTTAGIEPVTFRFVAQHFNHCATLPRSPRRFYTADKFFLFSSKRSIVFPLIDLCYEFKFLYSKEGFTECIEASHSVDTDRLQYVLCTKIHIPFVPHHTSFDFLRPFFSLHAVNLFLLIWATMFDVISVHSG